MGSGAPISWLVVVTGRVQGVYYRAFTRGCARELGISGWVRNEPDGSVMAFLQHQDEEVLAAMVTRMRNGPPGSRVEGLETTRVETRESWGHFDITR